MNLKLYKNQAPRIKQGVDKIIGYGTWLIIFLLLVSVGRKIGKVRMIRQELEAERVKIDKIRQENEDLNRQVLNIQGADFVEKQIRDKLGLVKEGEAVVVLPDEDVLRSLAPKVVEDDSDLPDPNWRKWAKLFF